MALQKLGLFILEAHKVGRKKYTDLPLIMSVRNDKTGTTLVLAVMTNKKEKKHRNDFQMRFEEAVQKTGVRSRHDSFTTGMIEIGNHDWKEFMDCLKISE